MRGKSDTKNKPRNYWDYQKYIITPNSKFKFIWRIVIAYTLLYHLMIFPYRVAFGNHIEGFQVMDGIMDLLFFADFFFHFFYSYINKRQQQVKSFKPIFLRYLTRSMIFDMVALYPYYFGNDYDLYWLKVARFQRTFDMFAGITMSLDELFLKIKNNMNFALSITRIIK
jgi:hypothetical protein